MRKTHSEKIYQLFQKYLSRRTDFQSLPEKLFYSKSSIKKAHKIAADIAESGKIKPLIVVIDTEGPYILEGIHRLAALHILGKKSFPALVVIDQDYSTHLR